MQSKELLSTSNYSTKYNINTNVALVYKSKISRADLAAHSHCTATIRVVTKWTAQLTAGMFLNLPDYKMIPFTSIFHIFRR